jgi:hypothetical protein
MYSYAFSNMGKRQIKENNKTGNSVPHSVLHKLPNSNLCSLLNLLLAS